MIAVKAGPTAPKKTRIAANRAIRAPALPMISTGFGTG